LDVQEEILGERDFEEEDGENDDEAVGLI